MAGLGGWLEGLSPHIPALPVEAPVAQSDVVVIFAPPYAHAEPAIQSLEAGKHVLCEKPLARTSVEAQAIAAAAKRTGKHLKEGANHRYFASVIKAHQLITEAAIGRPLALTASIGVDGSRFPGTWHLSREISGGGTLLANGHHVIGLARWFMGSEFVSSYGRRVHDRSCLQPESTCHPCLTLPVTTMSFRA